MLDNIIQLIEKDGLSSPSRRIELAYKRYYLFNALRDKGLTLNKIGEMFNRDHSVVSRGIESHNKLMSEEYNYNGMTIKGNLEYLSVINEFKKRYDNLLSNSNEHQQTILRVNRYSSSEDQGGKIAADSGAGESPYSKGCSQ